MTDIGVEQLPWNKYYGFPEFRWNQILESWEFKNGSLLAFGVGTSVVDGLDVYGFLDGEWVFKDCGVTLYLKPEGFYTLAV